MTFTGFPEEALDFLAGLKKHNNRTWFEKNRKTYESCLVEPGREFVAAMGKQLAKVTPQVVAEPKIGKTIMRINRDTRFSKDKRPYKEHFAFFFTHGPGKGRPGYYLHFTNEELILGGGTYCFGDKLANFRQAVDNDRTGKQLADIVKKTAKAKYDVHGLHYKRVPRGYDADHPRADLLKHDGLYAGVDLAVPPELHTGKFPAFCLKHFKKLSPLNDWVAEMLDG